jgi:hypothetical protein
VPADADDARGIAEQILSAPEYQEPAQPWWQKALEKVDELLSRFFRALSGAGGGSSVVAWVILVVAVVGATIVVVLAVRSLRRSRRAKGVKDDVPAPRRSRREPRVDWDAEAAKLEAEGRWRDGLRARYRALVADLSRRQVVDPAASRTTGEHRREVGRAAPDVAPEFSDAAELFDRAWYGNRPTGPEEAERFRELARAVEERER